MDGAFTPFLQTGVLFHGFRRYISEACYCLLVSRRPCRQILLAFLLYYLKDIDGVANLWLEQAPFAALRLSLLHVRVAA